MASRVLPVQPCKAPWYAWLVVLGALALVLAGGIYINVTKPVYPGTDIRSCPCLRGDRHGDVARTIFAPDQDTTHP